MKIAWNPAIAKRARPSPNRIVRDDVGVANMRCVTRSCRDWMSNAEPARDVMNTKRIRLDGA
jgi:hypothetical protein